MPTLTIITPTYNRAKLLRQCWNSLNQQTCKDFQWLVVDDGSTDDTSAVVEEMMALDHEYMFQYVKKDNGGKHTALNYAHPYILGDYVLVLDSDDLLTETAVQQVLDAWREFESDSTVGRVIFLKGFSRKEPICHVLHEGVPLDTLKEPRIGTAGRDCCDTFRSELFRKYPFPVFPGERFIGEGAAFFFMEKESLGVYVNQVIYLCQYYEDGLTKAGRKMRIENPLGGRYNSMVYMDKRLPLKTRVKKAVLYTCYSLYARVPVGKWLIEPESKLLTLAGLVPGMGLYVYWKIKFYGRMK